VEQPGAKLTVCRLKFLLEQHAQRERNNNQADNPKPNKNRVQHDGASLFIQTVNLTKMSWNRAARE
jgi:hypothetical protein